MAERGRKTKAELAEIAARRRRVEELFLRGEPQWKIAQKESVSPATISRDIEAVLKEWQEKRLEYCEQAVQIELGKISRLELEYWNAWVRSCEVAEKTSTKIVREQDGDGVRTEDGTVKEWQGGDPRFLEGVRWCIDRRLKLFGKDEAAKAPVDKDGNTWRPCEVTKMTDEEVVVVNRIYERLIAKAPAGANGQGGTGAAALN